MINIMYPHDCPDPPWTFPLFMYGMCVPFFIGNFGIFVGYYLGYPNDMFHYYVNKSLTLIHRGKLNNNIAFLILFLIIEITLYKMALFFGARA